MKYSKIILICSILLLLISVIFYVFFSDPKPAVTTNTTTNNSPAQSQNALESSDIENIQQDPTTPIIKQENNQLTVQEKSNTETLLSNNIAINLRNWQISKSIKYLDQAITLSYDTDNESVFENWKEFMTTNSSSLFQNISTDSSSEKILTTASIFEWFIEGSGEYEKLSEAKKQELAQQFNQIRIIKNQRSLE